MEALICPAWAAMSPSDKQARLLDQALDRKWEILALPLPGDGDDSLEATRLRALDPRRCGQHDDCLAVGRARHGEGHARRRS